MNILTATFSAIHWLGVAVYTGSFVFLILIFQKTYRRYRSYKYVDNFRAEIIGLYWKFLHASFFLIVLSGAALAGSNGKSVLKGLYGFIFSGKLVLWLVQIYVSQDLLKPFPPEISLENPGLKKTPNDTQYHMIVLVLLLLISLCGFGLKYV